MKRSILSKTIAAAIVVLSFADNAIAQNLITNGDFESGGSGTGFTSNYNLTTGPSVQKTYAIVTNPNTINAVWSAGCTDHTSGTGKMMVVDGSFSAADKIWEQVPGGGITVTSGSTYTFTYWIQSISSTNAVGNLADIEVRINNVVLTPATGSTVCPASLCGWAKVTYKWTATSGTAQIWLFDKTLGAIGNDFALDDLSLVADPLPLALNYSVIPTSCPNSTDGAIVVYGSNGIPPYTYSLNGGPYVSSGIFSGLAATTGNYVSVKDAASPTPTNVTSASNISVAAATNPLTKRSDTTIHPGGSVMLNAAGSSGSYFWTANPPDPTLTNPNIPNPVVSPIVPTTYTVSTTNSATQDLAFNAGFESGNVGFATDYIYYAATLNHKSYGVVTDPHVYDVNFITSTDHSGTGNMMVVDGSDVNAGNDKVWCQTYPVTINTNYTFSYWIQTIATPSPAQIETQVNGNPVTGSSVTSTFTASATPTGWSQVIYNWNSGAATSVQVCMYDRNIVGTGNDFALDDIAFTRSTSCLLSSDVHVNVVSPLPINLLSFTAEWKDNKQNAGLLKWSTATEINNQYFELERSLDGTNFISVGRVKGAGNSNIVLNYSYNDPLSSQRAAVFYYRLKEIAVDAHFTYSNIASIRRNNGLNPIIIYPNPASGHIDLLLTKPLSLFTLYDASGKKILEEGKIVNNTHTINIGTLASGIYIYSATFIDNSKDIGKVIVK